MTCPTSDYKNRPIFNPVTKECGARVKFPIEGKCHAYRECFVDMKVSPFGRWKEIKCESNQHFDPITRECIDAKDSTCGI